MTADLIYSAIGASVGAGSSVFFVFRILLSAIKDDIRETKITAHMAHTRIDRILEKVR